MSDRPPTGAIVKGCEMPALVAGVRRRDEAARAGVAQASREETAACSGAVRRSYAAMGIGRCAVGWHAAVVAITRMMGTRR